VTNKRLDRPLSCMTFEMLTRPTGVAHVGFRMSAVCAAQQTAAVELKFFNIVNSLCTKRASYDS
jgi:hypothetical protein